jgi:hypothetical protein
MTKQEVKNEVLLHMGRVRDYMRDFTDELKSRAFVHDMSKTKSPELEMLEEVANFNDEKYEYGTSAYTDMQKNIEPLLKAHIENNTHHPEHYERGLDDMDLYDICEMFLDWKAASEKHSSGNIWKSIEVGKERFGMSDQLYNILKNTADRTWENDKS